MTVPVCPLSVCRHLPELTSQMRTVLSTEALAILNAQGPCHQTGACVPRRGRGQGGQGRGLGRGQGQAEVYAMAEA